ncbi:MAG: hypothetical protein K9M81_03850 [Chthoniobacterales bacterium]|nr:hypothetical protein [Chthoniobacterales bacterium]
MWLSTLTRIFHTKSITACGELIITALVSNCDLGGMKHTARHQNARLPYPISLSGLRK